MQRRRKLIAALMLSVLLVGCGGNFFRDFYERVFVSPTTSIVRALENRVRIDIPANAFNQSVTFLFANFLGVPPFVTALLSSALEFIIEGQQPAEKLLLNVAYDPSEVPEGYTEADLKMFKVEGENLILIPDSVVDTVEKIVSAEVDESAVYVVGVVPDE